MTGSTAHVAFGIEQTNRRTQLFTSGWTVFRIHNFDVSQTCEFVSLMANGQAVFHVDEFHITGKLSHDGVGVWIPGCNNLSALHFLGIGYSNNCTVWQFIALALATT